MEATNSSSVGAVRRMRTRLSFRYMTVPCSAQRPQLNTAQTFPQQDAAGRGLNKPARTTTMQIEALKRDRTRFDASWICRSFLALLLRP